MVHSIIFYGTFAIITFVGIAFTLRFSVQFALKLMLNKLNKVHKHVEKS